MRRSGDAAPKEEDLQRSGGDGKEFMTKSEYNRWLLRQENSKMADDARQSAKAGEEIIKERLRKHTAQGLSRQQAAMVQMKKASESLEAHRQQNLSHGRKVYEEVAGWRTGAKQTKEDWATYGKGIKEAQKKDNATAASIAAMRESKQKQAAATRSDDQLKEAERDKLRKDREKEVAHAAQTVRADTSDDRVDAAKRTFFEQRLKAAQETRAQSASSSKVRTERNATWNESQQKRRLKAKTARGAALKSREAMLTQKAEAAAEMRQKKANLTDTHKERMQELYLEKAAAVKAVIANSIFNESEPTGSAVGKPASPKAAIGSTA